MKPMHVARPLLMLALAASLASCGGKNSYILSGVASGVAADGLILSNGGQTVSVPANVTAATTTGGTPTINNVLFQFPNKIGYGDAFNVTITGMPPHESCTIAGNTGTAGTTSTSNISVSCFANTFLIRGTVTGYTGAAGLVLSNGADTVTISANQTVFNFPGRVPFGGTYGVTIQPGADQACHVENGVGKLNADADVTNVKVVCP